MESNKYMGSFRPKELRDNNIDGSPKVPNMNIPTETTDPFSLSPKDIANSKAASQKFLLRQESSHVGKGLTPQMLFQDMKESKPVEVACNDKKGKIIK